MNVPAGQSTYWTYLRSAFNRRVPVPVLGHLPLNVMVVAAAGVLGLANPGFWLLGAAGEVLFLVLKASSPRFQKLLEGERLLAEQQTWEEKVGETVARLEAISRARYRRLLGQCRRILGISDALDADSLGNFRDLRARSLNQLLGIYLRLLSSREVIESNLSRLDRTELEAEAMRLQERLAAAAGDAALARSIQGTLDIQKKRLDNLARAQATQAVIDSELERIEQQVELIREEAAVTGRPEQLSVRLDAVTSTMTETTRWMEEHAEFLGSLAGDEAAVDLPELPKVAEGE